LPEDERVGVVLRTLHPIPSQELRFDVTLHLTRAEQFLLHSQKRNGEGNVKLHVKCSCSQNHCSNRRRVIVHPSRDTDCGKAVSKNDHVLDSDFVALGDMARKSVHISDHVGKIIRGAAFARRSPVPACIPRENGDVLESE
jgi:hypothetical protein